jgi:phosphatidylserine/phosphatidylglycerophosphate/cardiolipin synthase-like enzyme
MVWGNDVLHGSSNFSTSSTSKHSEDRFMIRNEEDTAADYKAEFERLWAVAH